MAYQSVPTDRFQALEIEVRGPLLCSVFSNPHHTLCTQPPPSQRRSSRGAAAAAQHERSWLLDGAVALDMEDPPPSPHQPSLMSRSASYLASSVCYYTAHTRTPSVEITLHFSFWVCGAGDGDWPADEAGVGQLEPSPCGVLRDMLRERR